jgi:uncharacterized protein
MGNPLLINVAELLRRPGSARDVTLDVTSLELDLDDPRLVADAPIDVRLHLESLSDGVVVTGLVDAPWTDTCRRCLGPATGTTASDVHEIYQHTVTDPDACELVGDQVDLRPMVRELVLLDLPVTALCRPDCAGLCPTCGVDRNTQSCACTATDTDPRWDALSQLRGSADT